MYPSFAITVIASLTVLFDLGLEVHGHGDLIQPLSRQSSKTRGFVSEDDPTFEPFPTTYSSGDPFKDEGVLARQKRLMDPETFKTYNDGGWPLLTVFERGEMAANGNFLEPDAVAVRHGICGDPGKGRGRDEVVYGTANKNWPVLTEYKQGSIVEFKVRVTASHQGHFEFFICNADDLDDPEGIITQSCFNKNPLTRAEGDDLNSPIDPNFTGRYYAEPKCRGEETDQTRTDELWGGFLVHMKYQLPPDLTCTHCIVQWVWYTGDRCKMIGYDDFNPPSWPSTCAPTKKTWMQMDDNDCGSKWWEYPQEYINCSDIAIIPHDSTCIELGEGTCTSRSQCCRDTSKNKKAKCKKGRCCNKEGKKCKKDWHCCKGMKCSDKRCVV